MSLTLYDKEECPFCWRVRIALRRLGLTVERCSHDDPQWQDVWPALTEYSTVPVLVAPNIVLTDSRVILEYLDDQHGGLLPESPIERALAREVWCYADAKLGPAVRGLVFERRDKAPNDVDSSVIEDSVARWTAALPKLDAWLGGRDWFVGDCSIADYVVATRFGLAMAYGMPTSDLSRDLAAWVNRVFERTEIMESAPSIVRDWLGR